jgi:hypothetical protein
MDSAELGSSRRCFSRTLTMAASRSVCNCWEICTSKTVSRELSKNCEHRCTSTRTKNKKNEERRKKKATAGKPEIPGSSTRAERGSPVPDPEERDQARKARHAESQSQCEVGRWRRKQSIKQASSSQQQQPAQKARLWKERAVL